MYERRLFKRRRAGSKSVTHRKHSNDHLQGYLRQGGTNNFYRFHSLIVLRILIDVIVTYMCGLISSY